MPVKFPVKLEAVIIPEVLMFIDELRLLAVVAVPVRLPTKLEAVIIPVVLILIFEGKLDAVVAVPAREPTKLEAVIIPATLTLVAVKNPIVAIPEETSKLVTEAIPPTTFVEVPAKEIVFVMLSPSPIAL